MYRYCHLYTRRVKTHRSTQLFLYYSGGELSVKYVRPALEMNVSEEEQRGVVRFLVTEDARTLYVPDKRARVAEEIPRSTHITARRFMPIETLRLMWLRGLIVWSGRTDESQRKNSCSIRTRKCKSGWGCWSMSGVYKEEWSLKFSRCYSLSQRKPFELLFTYEGCTICSLYVIN